MGDYEVEYAIETILNTKTREWIISIIDSFGDPIDWSELNTRDILEEVAQSDQDAGEVNNGILASMYQEM